MFRCWKRTAAVIALTVAACLVAGCGGKQEEPESTLGKAERDSVLSESALPGASAVKGALAVTDSARARADRANEAAGN